MTYAEYKAERQKSANDLPIFFAFSSEQLEEEMNKRGLTTDDTDKIYDIGNGGFCLKKDANTVSEWFNAKDPLDDLMKDQKFAEDAFFYEMCNHEYGINYQGDWDVCCCFGEEPEFKEYKDGPTYLREMGFSDDIVAAYKNAKRKYWEEAIEKEWF